MENFISQETLKIILDQVDICKHLVELYQVNPPAVSLGANGFAISVAPGLSEVRLVFSKFGGGKVRYLRHPC